jgi:3-dehydroquinate synthase
MRTDVDRLKRLLQHVNLPTSPPNDISPEQLLDVMQLDKKVIDGNLRLILLRSIGHATITEKVNRNEIRQAIAATI